MFWCHAIGTLNYLTVFVGNLSLLKFSVFQIPLSLKLYLSPLLFMTINHRLKIELDLQSLFGFHVHICTHWLRPATATPPPPAFGRIYEGAIGQPK
jgi:hypothetical protein